MRSEKLSELKKKMVSGEATAETFEEAITEQGLTVQLICLISIYYAGDYKEDEAKLKASFEAAVVSAGVEKFEEVTQ